MNSPAENGGDVPSERVSVAGWFSELNRQLRLLLFSSTVVYIRIFACTVQIELAPVFISFVCCGSLLVIIIKLFKWTS